MNFNKFLKSLFGDKSTRDMKLIQPMVEVVKSHYEEIKALSNDDLRAKTKEIQQFVQAAAKEEKDKIAELKATIEDTPLDEREVIFNQIDKLEKEALDKYADIILFLYRARYYYMDEDEYTATIYVSRSTNKCGVGTSIRYYPECPRFGN